jgi:hypothetical protein
MGVNGYASVVEKLLELGYCCIAVMCHQLGLAAQVHGVLTRKPAAKQRKYPAVVQVPRPATPLQKRTCHLQECFLRRKLNLNLKIILGGSIGNFSIRRPPLSCTASV